MWPCSRLHVDGCGLSPLILPQGKFKLQLCQGPPLVSGSLNARDVLLSSSRFAACIHAGYHAVSPGMQQGLGSGARPAPPTVQIPSRQRAHGGAALTARRAREDGARGGGRRGRTDRRRGREGADQLLPWMQVVAAERVRPPARQLVTSTPREATRISPRPFAATRRRDQSPRTIHGISASRPRRRRDLSPRNVHVAAAASLRPVSAECPRRCDPSPRNVRVAATRLRVRRY